jgi:hypothetical protein
VGHFRFLISAAALVGCGLSAGCAVPSFDVPHDNYDQPTVTTIIQRIQCEIRDMVRDDRPGDPASFHRLFLMNGDYDVLVALSLEVNDTGGLAPTISYVTPLAVATSWTFGATATLSKGRDHTFTENIEISARQIYSDWKSGVQPYDCPVANTNLAGELGLKDFVSMATSSPDLDAPGRREGRCFWRNNTICRYEVALSDGAKLAACTLQEHSRTGIVVRGEYGQDYTLFLAGQQQGKAPRSDLWLQRGGVQFSAAATYQFDQH